LLDSLLQEIITVRDYSIMPQKPNAYFFYMQHMKRTVPAWSRKGYPELSGLCSNSWNKLTKAEKQVYENERVNSNLVVQKKKKNQGKTDCLGRPLEFIQNAREEQKQLAENELKVVEQMIKSLGQQCVNTDYYMIFCTNYCITTTEPIVYCPAEISIGAFNLTRGFKVIYNAIIEAEVPHGYRLMIRDACEKLLKIPEDFKGAIPKSDVAGRIAELLSSTRQKVFFCHPNYRETCTRNLRSIFRDYGDLPFKVFSLAQLAYAFDFAKNGADEATCCDLYSQCLDHERRGLELGLGCTWHEENTELALCSTSVLNKWSLSLAERLGPMYKITVNNTQN